MSQQTHFNFPRSVVVRLKEHSIPLSLVPTKLNSDVKITYSMGFAGDRVVHDYSIAPDFRTAQLLGGLGYKDVVNYILEVVGADVLAEIIFDKMMYDLIESDSDLWPWNISIRKVLGDGHYQHPCKIPGFVYSLKGLTRPHMISIQPSLKGVVQQWPFVEETTVTKIEITPTS